MNDDQLFQTIFELAESRSVAPASLSMKEIAQSTGISRSSLYRRFGSRDRLNNAMLQDGFQVGVRVAAEDRLIIAAHDLIVMQGVQALTLESVAASADVALPTVYGLFQNRSRLMRAVFTKYSPVPRVADAIPQVLPKDHDAFRQVIERVYHALWDFLTEEQSLIFAIVAEISRDPKSIVMDWLQSEYLPQVTGTIFPIIADAMDADLIEDGSPVMAGQALVGPMIFHCISRPILEHQGIRLPSRDEVCADLAILFCKGSLKGAIL